VNKDPAVKLASVDSTGFEARHVSQYFLHRKSRGKPIYARFHPQLGIICDTEDHLILSLYTRKGPFPDPPSFKYLLANIPSGLRVDKILGDAGYDSEPNHQLARTKYGIRTFFPPLCGPPTKKTPQGKYRRLMKTLFKFKKNIHYGQRWQVETVFSMIKRRLTTATKARSHYAQMRELALIAITHNLLVVWLRYLFYRAGRSPILSVSVIP
jgi:hypothetical protein